MNKQQLASKIWESANKMRSKIEANEYKDYILGFIFYKFLSENELMRLKDTDFTEDDLQVLGRRIIRTLWKAYVMNAATSSPITTCSPRGCQTGQRFRHF